MQKYSATQNQISAENEGKTVILKVDVGEYFGLNAVGTHIWELLEKEPISISDIKKSVLDHFDVNEDVCEQDIKNLLEQLLKENLVALTD